MDLLLNEEILVVFPLMPRWKVRGSASRIKPHFAAHIYIQDVQQSNNFLHIWTSQCCPLPGADAWTVDDVFKVSNKEELCCHLVAMDIGWRIDVIRYTPFASNHAVNTNNQLGWGGAPKHTRPHLVQLNSNKKKRPSTIKSQLIWLHLVALFFSVVSIKRNTSWHVHDTITFTLGDDTSFFQLCSQTSLKTLRNNFILLRKTKIKRYRNRWASVSLFDATPQQSTCWRRFLIDSNKWNPQNKCVSLKERKKLYWKNDKAN